MARTTEYSDTGESARAGQRTGRADADAGDSLDSVATRAPRGRSYAVQSAWRSTAVFGAGVAMGALIGAGAALLFAPQSGEDTRELLAERAHRLGGRVSDRLEDARGDLGWYLRRGRRSVGRGVSRGRWAGEDLADRMRRGW